jgi:hypothetical protein
MLIANTFETGLADETTITVANSDDGAAGTAWDAISFGGGITAVYDDDLAAHGPRSGKFVIGTDIQGYVEWSTAMGTQTEIWGRVYAYHDTAPPDNQYLVAIRGGGGYIALIYLAEEANRKVFVFNAGLASSVATTLNYPLDQWVRYEFHVLCHATLGIVHVKLFQGDSTTVYDEVNRTNVNTGTSIDTIRFGQSNTRITSFNMDDIEVNNTGWSGPVIPASGFQRFSGPELLTASAGTLHRAPPASRDRIHQIRLVNNDEDNTVAVTLSIGTDAAATRIFSDTLAAGESRSVRGPLTLEAAEIVQGSRSPASFPTTSILDTFTGSDETPIATNWTAPLTPTDNSARRISNQFTPAVAGGWSGAYYDLATYGPDSECYVTLATVGTATVWVRTQAPGTSGVDGYNVLYSSATFRLSIIRVDNAVATNLENPIISALSAGDAIGIRAIGSTIQSWVRRSGVWELVSSVTDTTYAGAGALASETEGTVARLDDFSGGTIPSSVTATIVGIRESL